MQRRSFSLAAVSFLVLTGCVSPTLPLPPPDAPLSLSVDVTTNEWTITGNCLQGALVTVFNEATGQGSVVEDRDLDGKYEIRLQATRCDLAWVQQTIGQDASAPTTFVIDETVNGIPVDPQACK